HSMDSAPRVAITDAVQSTGQRTVGDHRDAILAAVWQEIFLNSAVDQAIADLIGNNRKRLESVLGCLKLCYREIADTDLAALALIHQPCQRAHGFGDGNGGIGLVKLDQIDGVDAEFTQAALHGLADARGVKILRRDFSRDKDTIAHSGDRLA